MKIDVDKIARVISAIISPLWIPTFGFIIWMTTSYLIVLTPAVRITMTAVIFVVTGLLPLGAVYALKRIGYVSDLDVSDRRQRTVPYICMAICYFSASVFLRKINCPPVLANMMYGATLAVLIMTIINRWWKISAHGAGCGAWLAMLMVEAASGAQVVSVFPFFVIAVILVGLTGTSRVILGRHTVAQVICGWLLGFLCVYLF